MSEHGGHVCGWCGKPLPENGPSLHFSPADSSAGSNQESPCQKHWHHNHPHDPAAYTGTLYEIVSGAAVRTTVITLNWVAGWWRYWLSLVARS